MKERKQQYSNFTFVIIKQVVSDEEFKQLAKIVDNLVPLSVSYMQLGSNNAKNLVLCYVQLAKGKHVLKKRMRIALSCLVNKVYAVEASNVGLTLGRLYKQMEIRKTRSWGKKRERKMQKSHKEALIISHFAKKPCLALPMPKEVGKEFLIEEEELICKEEVERKEKKEEITLVESIEIINNNL